MIKRVLFLCSLLFLQACATIPNSPSPATTAVILSASELGHRLYELKLLNEGQTEKAKRLMEMDVNALLLVLDEYDKQGELRDEAKLTFEAAKTYRRQHPFKVTEQDKQDYPEMVVDADELIEQILSEKSHH